LPLLALGQKRKVDKTEKFLKESLKQLRERRQLQKSQSSTFYLLSSPPAFLLFFLPSFKKLLLSFNYVQVTMLKTS
jgi:hypothetical protein